MSKNSLKGLNHKLVKKISGPPVPERIVVESMGRWYTQFRTVRTTEMYKLLFLRVTTPNVRVPIGSLLFYS
jgi:hypothetical protein